MVKNILKLGFAIILASGLFCISDIALAEEKTNPDTRIKEEIVIKEVKGEVTGISPNFIAVLYGEDTKRQVSLEMAFDVTKDAKIENKKNLTDIRVGDTVTVTYEEKTEKNKEGKVRVKGKLVKKIVFKKAGTGKF